MQPPTTQKDNSLAIASLVLGIFAMLGAGILTGVPAIITGAIALKNPVHKGMSIAGIVMGIISTVLTILVVLLFVFLIAFAAFSEPQPVDQSTPVHDDYAPSIQQRA